MSAKKSTTRKNRSKAKSVTIPNELPEPEIKENHFQFISKHVSIHLHCPSCAKLMHDPVRLHPCAHTFCRKCAPSGKCSRCMKYVAVIQKDLTGQKLVNELEVKCLNDGCPYRDTYDNYKRFHHGKCNLKSGIDDWLKNMRDYLNNQQKVKKRRAFSSDQEAQNNKQKANLKPQMKILPRPEDKAQKIGVIYEDQFNKYIRKDL